MNESGDPQLAEHLRAELDGISPRRQAIDRAIMRFVERIADLLLRRWLFVVNLSLALMLGGAFAVAYLRSIGASWLAEPLSTAYLLLCQQRPDHSYFPFGYQMALEQRLVAMFGAQILGGLVFGLLRGRLHPLNWKLMILLSLPIAWDGFSQMFGFRDSDWLTRTWTGGLFNLALVWFVYPRVEDALASARIARPGKGGDTEDVLIATSIGVSGKASSKPVIR